MRQPYVRLNFEKFNNKCCKCNYKYTDNIRKRGPFEIHHKDGNHDNWKKDNLIVLCLNCHWKTPNWRFRGKKHNKETLKKLKECWKSRKPIFTGKLNVSV